MRPYLRWPMLQSVRECPTAMEWPFLDALASLRKSSKSMGTHLGVRGALICALAADTDRTQTNAEAGWRPK